MNNSSFGGGGEFGHVNYGAREKVGPGTSKQCVSLWGKPGAIPAPNLSNTLLFKRVWSNEGGRFEDGCSSEAVCYFAATSRNGWCKEGGRAEGGCCS